MNTNQVMTISNIFEQIFTEGLNEKLNLGWQISSTNIGSYPEDTVEGFGEVWQAILTRPADYSVNRIKELKDLIQRMQAELEYDDYDKDAPGNVYLLKGIVDYKAEIEQLTNESE